jgi:preprotein translocase subunit YajC
MPIHFTIAQTPPAPPQQPAPDMSGTLLMFGAMMVIMWVLMIRPQQKRQKELLNRIASLKTGDRVVTASGVHGVVANVKDGPTLVLKVDDNCKLTVDKTSISTVLAKETKENA